jgi:uncharacterized membrane protein YoaK (UPF0700 family)
MISYLRYLAGRERTREANRHLGFTLAFVAGAVNAGGFLAVAQYTSHVTGVLSSIADDLALGRFGFIAPAAGVFVAFVLGAMTCAVLVNWARRRRMQAQFALSLALEAALLLLFGLLGERLKTRSETFAPTVLLLSYIMGLQNAVITKLSGAEIRTTHMTGNTTDFGIELGKLLYLNAGDGAEKVLADREKLRIHGSLIALFVAGGVAGAWGFKQIGFAAVLPIALLLFAIAAVPVLDDMLFP